MAKKPSKKVVSKKSPKSKATKRVVKKEESLPVEVLVYDCVLHERVIAEYRNESRWWYGTRMFKVYHPAFTQTPDNSRWVFKLGRILGQFRPEVIPPMAEEQEAIKELVG